MSTGRLTLAPNTVPWAANDAVEEPHYYQQDVAADATFVGADDAATHDWRRRRGWQYEANVGPGLSGWTVANACRRRTTSATAEPIRRRVRLTQAAGIWQRTMDMQAGEQSVFSVHCNSHGCGRWNSSYNLFELDSSAGVDTMSYQPQTSTLQMSMRGTTYQFSPQAFTAGTINAGTVNATTLNGAVSAAQLPLFGISGSGHAPGAVPDPGATAGSTRYLREDGTWAVPAGSGGSGGLGVGSGSSGTAPIAGATADYNFLQGSGTVLTDISGNGNNGTLGTGALAPTWTPQGLTFTGQQPGGAACFAERLEDVSFRSLSATDRHDDSAANSFPMLLGSSVSGSGLNLLYDYASDSGNLAQNTYALAPSIYGSGAGVFANTKNLVSGFHVLTYVLGSTSTGQRDTIYIDGVRATVGAFDFFSSGLQTSGNLFLGSSNAGIFGTSGLNGTMYRFAAFPGASLTRCADHADERTGEERDCQPWSSGCSGCYAAGTTESPVYW